MYRFRHMFCGIQHFSYQIHVFIDIPPVFYGLLGQGITYIVSKFQTFLSKNVSSRCDLLHTVKKGLSVVTRTTVI